MSPSEERPQTRYCSDYMSIKHRYIEKEQREGRENRKRERRQKEKDGSKAREKEQPEQKKSHYI